MKITKTQLQNIIREELDALSEDEQLDEFFGPFSKKARRKKALQKQRLKNPGGMTDAEMAQLDADLADSASRRAGEDEKNAAAIARSKREKELRRRRDNPTDAETRANRRAMDAKARAMGDGTDEDSPYTKDRIRRGGVGGVGRGGMRSSNYNRKDESKLRDKIREEVSKAIKEHFKK